jgi:pimeloyl-ACP methyl ester carboxylesterase
LLPHITTNNVARDVDRIRASLGEQRISYLGYSYGVYLGAVYASMFPERTDRFVLDSALGVKGMDHTWSRRFGLGFELRFPDFAKWAATQNDTYGLGRTPHEVRAKYFELAERLDAQPVNGVNGSTFRGLTFAFVFSDATFSFLAQYWQAADQGTVFPFPPPPGDFSGILALACNQPTWPRDVQSYQRSVAQDRRTFPMLGAATANIWPCAFWPFQPEAPARISDRGPTNILIVENLRDPGSPFPGALENRLALGNRARNLTIDEGGHMAYLFNTNACANSFVSTFLAGNADPVDAFCRNDGSTPQRAATPLGAPALAGLMLR